jgi:small-conductance mechanosensitive channel
MALESFFASGDTVRTVISLLDPFFSKIVIGSIVLLFGFILGKLFKRLAHKILLELEIDRLFVALFNTRVRFALFLSSFAGVVIYVTTIIMVLDILGLGSFILHILTGGVLVLMVALAVLTVKDFMPNVLASFAIHNKENVNVGTSLEFEGIKGKVTDMNLTDVQVTMSNGDIIHVPNTLFIKKQFKTRKQK